MVKNIFITGKPGIGKTTLIREILKEVNLPSGGFYTQEIREEKGRLGFKIITLDGKEGILSHINFKSPYKVGKYKVNLKDLEEIAVRSMLEALGAEKLIVIDEIGKQEMFSEKFKEAVILALESKNKVLGTIKITPDPFTNKIRERKDTIVWELQEGNREEIKEKLKSLLIS